MTVEISGFVIRSKVWIEDRQGKAVFGPGRYRIFEAVERLQSLQAAAKELKMSYRAVWCRIKASEERLGKRLVIRDGRGSQLTPFARELMSAFLGIQAKVREESDTVFANLLSPSLGSSGQGAEEARKLGTPNSSLVESHSTSSTSPKIKDREIS